MDNAFARGNVLLFDEDFDLPVARPPPPEPEIIEPVFSLAELEDARAAAARAARETTLTECETSAMAAARGALDTIAAEIAAARETFALTAEQAAEGIARLLLDCFAAAFPALSARHGSDEIAAVLREILPALRHEPKVVVRVSPHIAAAMTAEIERMDPDLIAHVRVVATDAIGPEDARIAWEHGSAIRDTAALWSNIESILAPAGLLSPRQTTPPSPPQTTPPSPRQTMKERANVD